MDVWHVTIASEGRVRLFPDEEQRLAAIHAAVRVLGPRLWSFGFVDDHDHFAVHAKADEIALLAGNLRRVLGALDGAAPLQPAHRKPLEGRQHLLRLLAYHVEQPAKHGLLVEDAHPAAWSGSSFADLAGARCIPGFSTAGLARELPRVDLAAVVLQAAGLSPVGSATAEDLGAIGVGRLWDATLSAVGLASAERDTPREATARVAFAHLIRASDLDRAEATELLGIESRSWRRLSRREADPAVLAAVRRRVAIDRAVRRQSASAAPVVAAGSPQVTAAR